MAANRRLGQLTSVENQENTRLASGDRIAQAGWDPSGLAISSVMKAEIRSKYQAQRNINDGVSLLQVAEGTLSAIHQMSIRMKELAVAAATDTLGASERQMLDLEFQATKREYERQREASSYNEKSILNGSDEVYDLQVGIRNQKREDRISYDLSQIMKKDFGFSHMQISNKEGARQALSQVDHMIDEVSRSRAHLGSISNRLEAAHENLTISNENQQDANSKIRDTNMAESTARRAVAQINKQATIAGLAQANANPNKVLKLMS